MQKGRILSAVAVAGAMLVVVALPAHAADADAAKAFAKKNDCFKCHAVDKTKKGPSYQKLSAKIKADKITDEKLVEHLTSSKKVKLEDGSEEEHKALNMKDADKIKNLIAWIREQ